MYNPKDVQFVGKHGFSRDAILGHNRTFSVGIFKWELKGNGKALKKGKALVRVTGLVSAKEKVFTEAEEIVRELDLGIWDGRKTVNLVK